MPLKSGTYTIGELQAVTDATVKKFGEDKAYEALQADLDFHNEAVREQLAELATPTTATQDRYGTNDDTEMEEADEFSRAKTQTVSVGDVVGYPLRKFIRGVGFTKDYLERATVAELAGKQIAVETSHVVALGRAISRALFIPTNYTFRDIHVDEVDIHVKRLVNGDGGGIPNGPFGEQFDPATHSHYNAIDWAAATVSQREAAVAALITDVVEHGHGKGVVIYVNQGDETLITDLPGFKPYLDARIRPGTNQDVAVGTLDTTQTNNRAIGLYRSAEVWTKPWEPENYFLCFARGAAAKPLKFREDTIASRRGLRLGGEIPAYPLLTKNYEAFFGLGVYTRTAAAVLYIGGGAYQSPTL